MNVLKSKNTVRLSENLSGFQGLTGFL